MSQIDATSFFVIVTVAGLAGLLRTSFELRFTIPVLVIELVLGIIIGPKVAELAHVNAFTNFFGELGLAMLFFFAGYELELDRIRGRPLQIGLLAWAMSLALAFAIGGVLAIAGLVLSLLYTGSAMATTALGALVPMLSDSGEMKTRYGGYLVAYGAVGEFGPIMLVTLFLSTEQPFNQAALLGVFVVASAIAGVLAIRSAGRGWATIERTLESSSQLATRMVILLIFGLVAIAFKLGLDVLLGGFVAGLITRLAVRGRETETFDSKLSAIGYGFLIPFFFITTGMKFDVTALFGSVGTLLRTGMYLVLFLVVRGLPALLLLRHRLSMRDRVALAFMASTQLPLVVAITTVALASHHMRVVTATALVGAGIVSMVVFPLIGTAIRRGVVSDEVELAEGVPDEVVGDDAADPLPGAVPA